MTWINKGYCNGRWTVALKQKMDNTVGGVSLVSVGECTFGIALNGANNPGGKHWGSLPMTLSFGGDDTDFTAEWH